MNRRVLIITVMTSLMLLAGCHASGGEMAKMRFVNQSDNAQVLEMRFRDLGALERVHYAIMGATPRGSYVLKQGTTTESGSVSFSDDAYVLKPQNGPERRYQLEKPDILKDEGGTLWKADNPDLKIVRKEW